MDMGGLPKKWKPDSSPVSNKFSGGNNIEATQSV
jgi:hypothetical protein